MIVNSYQLPSNHPDKSGTHLTTHIQQSARSSSSSGRLGVGWVLENEKSRSKTDLEGQTWKV